MPKVCCCYAAAVALFGVFLQPITKASADQSESSQSNDENSSAVLNLPIDSKAMKALDRAVDLINEEA